MVMLMSTTNTQRRKEQFARRLKQTIIAFPRLNFLKLIEINRKENNHRINHQGDVKGKQIEIPQTFVQRIKQMILKKETHVDYSIGDGRRTGAIT